MAVAATTHPLIDAQPYDPYLQERVLVCQILKQCCEDLHYVTRRAEAADFLVHGFWQSWWRDLLPSLQRTTVVAFVHAVLQAPPRAVDIERPVRAPMRQVDSIVGVWMTRQGNTRQRVQLSCGHQQTAYANQLRVACRACVPALRDR